MAPVIFTCFNLVTSTWNGSNNEKQKWKTWRNIRTMARQSTIIIQHAFNHFGAQLTLPPAWLFHSEIVFCLFSFCVLCWTSCSVRYNFTCNQHSNRQHTITVWRNVGDAFSCLFCCCCNKCLDRCCWFAATVCRYTAVPMKIFCIKSSQQNGQLNSAVAVNSKCHND